MVATCPFPQHAFSHDLLHSPLPSPNRRWASHSPQRLPSERRSASRHGPSRPSVAATVSLFLSLTLFWFHYLKKKIFFFYSLEKKQSSLFLEGVNCCTSRRTRRQLLSEKLALIVSCSVASSAHPAQGMEKLAFKPEGYNFWTWRDHKIHYVEQGSGPPVVLIHGFGASSFHWRYNIPEIAKSSKVYAMDLLGFGWSEKALVDYDAAVWRDQIADFLKEKVKEPAVLVGNSLGAFAALIAAADFPDRVSGVVLLNSAGQFSKPNAQPSEIEESSWEKKILKPLKDVLQRIFLGFLFWQSKQPARVESVLKSVYIDSTNVDNYLIESITRPASDPNAGEVYYRLMSRFMLNQSKYTLDDVLSKLSCPLLLIWGDLDPWVGPAKAQRIKEFYPNTSLVNLQAGHCPHDEVPELVNDALIDWLSSLKAGTPA